ncbi:21878_t:CDS:2 [Dentiscutata erythropus]|uniref:21878_t:CDS:1 n=1 Tax=Dentiscutata erythropus TaxID=1348616 RepID=A0A9N9DAN1_9GLOM|nr:21878_t:CDS:2 [Dentiscutata erythropus]
MEDLYDSIIEVLQDSQDLTEVLNSQNYIQKENNDLKMKKVMPQKKKRTVPYIDNLNSKVFKLFKISMNDPEKIKLYKYRPKKPLKKATNNIIIQLPESDKPLNITLNLLLNN